MKNLIGLIIHLKKATSRTSQVEWIKAHAPCPTSVVEAVDGTKLNETERASYQKNLFDPIYPFELRLGEQGAFHSHRLCWQKIIDSGSKAGLILEDDLEFNPTTLEDVVKFVSSYEIEDSYVRFPIKKRETARRVIAQRNGLAVIEPKVIGLGAVGQLVGREAARRLLETTNYFDRPIDTFLQMRWVHRVKVLSVWPSTLAEVSNNLGGSLIQKKTPIKSKFLREWARFCYRRAVIVYSSQSNFDEKTC